MPPEICPVVALQVPDDIVNLHIKEVKGLYGVKDENFTSSSWKKKGADEQREIVTIHPLNTNGKGAIMCLYQ